MPKKRSIPQPRRRDPSKPLPGSIPRAAPLPEPSVLSAKVVSSTSAPFFTLLAPKNMDLVSVLINVEEIQGADDSLSLMVKYETVDGMVLTLEGLRAGMGETEWPIPAYFGQMKKGEMLSIQCASVATVWYSLMYRNGR